MTEHAAVIFVFFFLAEYASILLMCILTSIFFFGGYLWDFSLLLEIFLTIFHFFDLIFNLNLESSFNEFLIEKSVSSSFYFSGFILGIKSSIFIFIFIWCRASFPRIRFDQLMSFCWTVLLPLLFAFIILIPCILYSFDAFIVSFF